MASWSADAALKLVDELDQCVADLLPVNLAASMTTSNAEASAERFLSTVTTLKGSLQGLLDNSAVKHELTPQQEVVHLQQEIAAKDLLIADAELKIARWQEKCSILLTKHEENTKLA